jgi:hypothetical protein
MKGDVDITVKKNIFLHDFEADLVVTVRDRDADLTENPTVRVNFEIDGPTHGLKTKQRYSHMRDEYLEKMHGITVKRMNVIRFADVRHGCGFDRSEFSDVMMEHFRRIVHEEISSRWKHTYTDSITFDVNAPA